MSGKKGSKKGWCVYCGIQIPSGAAFCPRCGEPLHPSYIYDESIFSEEAVAEKGKKLRSDEIIPTPRPPIVLPTGKHRLYEGMIRGLVTGESGIIGTPVLGASNINPHFGFAEAQFVIKLEEDIGIEGVPDEILVQTREAGYFGIGDEVTLQGTIFKINLKRWNRPLYIILADHFYNESLQIGDEGLVKRKQVLYQGDHFYNEPFQIRNEILMDIKQALYQGAIRGSVTREPRTRAAAPNASLAYLPYGLGLLSYIGLHAEVCFVMELEEGFEGVPDEILVRSGQRGYFRIGDKVILQGKIIKEDLKWNRQSYVIHADHFYNESLQIGDEGFLERKQVLYEGMIRGSVTKESIIKVHGDARFAGTYFAMKLEGNVGIEGVPDEILVQTTKFGHFGIDDKVILQGRVVKKDLSQWGRPMYTILADHFYNESLKDGDEGLITREQVLYKGIIRGIVTRDSTTRVNNRSGFAGTYFAMKLEENIVGIPDEILVQTGKPGYFRIGDKVILQGKIFKEDLSQWKRLMYAIKADHYYNESLQIGDE